MIGLLPLIFAKNLSNDDAPIPGDRGGKLLVSTFFRLCTPSDIPPPCSGWPTSPFVEIDNLRGKKNSPTSSFILGLVPLNFFPEISPPHACWPFLFDTKPPPVCLVALSPPGLRPKVLRVSRATNPGGADRKFRVRKGRPVMSVVTAFPLLEIFPQ